MGPVQVRRLPDKTWAIDFGQGGTFITVTSLQLHALLVAIRDTGQFQPFPVRRT